MIKPKRYTTLGGLTAMHRGTLSETLAIAWLLQRGFDVFKNVSAHGLADLIGWKPGSPPELFDVKTLGFWRTGDQPNVNPNAGRLSDAQRAAGVRLVFVHPRNGFVGFDALEVAKSDTPQAGKGSGRPSGESHHRTTLCEKDVQKIREITRLKLMTNSDLAKRYGVSPGTIHNIARRKTWDTK